MAITLVAVVSAHPPPAYAPYSVWLEDDHGTRLRTFRGDGTTFVLGYLGERYNVRIANHGDVRVEAVLTVDGRDAVSGDPGDFVKERGYIVPPHGSVLVSGFRQSLERTAAFRFSRPEASYSSRMGTPENVGVIGVAFFSEQRMRRVVPPPYAPYYDDAPRASYGRGRATGDRDAEHSAPSRSGGAAASSGDRAAPAPPPSPAKRRAYRDDDVGAAEGASRLGTEYGESTYSPVTEIPFVRQNPRRPDAVLSVRYDDADGLIARGFDVYPRPTWAPNAAYEPDPFPRSHFAPPPP